MVELATKADLLATEQRLQTELRSFEQRLQTKQDLQTDFRNFSNELHNAFERLGPVLN